MRAVAQWLSFNGCAVRRRLCKAVHDGCARGWQVKAARTRSVPELRWWGPELSGAGTPARSIARRRHEHERASSAQRSRNVRASERIIVRPIKCVRQWEGEMSGEHCLSRDLCCPAVTRQKIALCRRHTCVCRASLASARSEAHVTFFFRHSHGLVAERRPSPQSCRGAT
jgi:hypothetical protein